MNVTAPMHPPSGQTWRPIMIGLCGRKRLLLRHMLSWRTAKSLALALPETEERDHFGSPSFRVKGKIFAQLSSLEQKERRALVKLSVADQAALTMSDPNTFVPAPHWGRYGWTYVQLATVDESLFRDVLFRSWRQIAPKKLVVLLSP